MAQFLLIDHSLKAAGSHHFEYALQMLHAAEACGYAPLLAVHEDFCEHDAIPAHWPVHGLFRFETYNKYTRFAELDRLGPGGRAALRIRWPWHARHLRRRREQRSDAFAADLGRLFAKVSLVPGDQAFLPTLSELELTGLATYLSREPWTREIDWHAQFHYPLYVGREPDYPRQDRRLREMREAVHAALALVENHRLRLYATTDPLTAQYNRLASDRFATLAYPINAAFQAPAGRVATPERPDIKLDVKYVGDARPEKGYQHLPALVDALWNDYVQPGRIRFCLQSNLPREQPRHGLHLAVAAARKTLEGRTSENLQLLTEPLASGDYCRTVLGADIGLLLYDEQRYYARCSGIFTEMIAAGIPVLTSAANWMSDQLDDATWDSQQATAAATPAIEQIDGRHLPWMVGRWRRRQHLTTGLLTFGPADAPATCELTVPQGATHLFVETAWDVRQWDAWQGCYAHLNVESQAEDDSPLADWTTCLGRSHRPRTITALIPLADGGRRLHVRFSNAFGRTPLTLAAPRFTFLAAESNASLPLGAVGLVAAQPQYAAPLLQNLIEHHAHFRRTAIEMGRRCAQWHHPQAVFRRLVGKSEETTYRRAG